MVQQNGIGNYIHYAYRHYKKYGISMRDGRAGRRNASKVFSDQKKYITNLIKSQNGSNLGKKEVENLQNFLNTEFGNSENLQKYLPLIRDQIGDAFGYAMTRDLSEADFANFAFKTKSEKIGSTEIPKIRDDNKRIPLTTLDANFERLSKVLEKMATSSYWVGKNVNDISQIEKLHSDLKSAKANFDLVVKEVGTDITPHQYVKANSEIKQAYEALYLAWIAARKSVIYGKIGRGQVGEFLLALASDPIQNITEQAQNIAEAPVGSYMKETGMLTGSTSSAISYASGVQLDESLIDHFFDGVKKRTETRTFQITPNESIEVKVNLSDFDKSTSQMKMDAHITFQEKDWRASVKNYMKADRLGLRGGLYRQKETNSFTMPFLSLLVESAGSAEFVNHFLNIAGAVENYGISKDSALLKLAHETAKLSMAAEALGGLHQTQGSANSLVVFEGATNKIQVFTVGQLYSAMTKRLDEIVDFADYPDDLSIYNTFIGKGAPNSDYALDRIGVFISRLRQHKMAVHLMAGNLQK